MSVLSVQGLVKIYGGRTVVNHVDLQVKTGEIAGLLGPNGAGKTTTFNMVVGNVRPNEGRIFIDDTEITQMPMYRRSRLGVGYLAQEASVFRKLTVRENILGILQCMNLNTTQQHERLDGVLEELGLSHLIDSRAYTLSGGERRRVEIARALVTNPKFILLDEPFSGVDPKAVEELQDIIRQMKQAGLGVLITDHNVRETLSVTDRSYIIHEGQVMTSGSAEELVNDEKARQHYFGERFYMRLDNQDEPPNEPADGENGGNGQKEQRPEAVSADRSDS